MFGSFQSSYFQRVKNNDLPKFGEDQRQPLLSGDRAAASGIWNDELFAGPA
jgi:hypothetical protein